MRSIALALALATAVLLLLGAAPPATASPGWQWPVRGPVITPYRNGSDPYAGGQHRGIDIAAPVGTPVVAATGGTVTFAGLLGSSGLAVAVRTADGRFDTSYLHLSSIRVAAGDVVAPGDSLGAVGTTGRRSAVEPHLHFGVRDAGSRFAYHDPLDFLPVAPPSPPSPAPRSLPVPVGVPAGPRLAPAPVPNPSGIAANVELPLAAVAAPVAGPHAGSQVAGVAVAEPPSLARPLATSPAGLRVGPVSSPGAMHRAGVGSRRPAPHRAPRIAPASAAPAAGPGPAHAPAPRSAAVGPARSRMTLRATARPRPGGRGDGFDPGWLVACIGLVGAAVALGRPARTARSVRRTFASGPRAIRSSQPASR